jgi:hypothetical protein
LFAKQLVDLDLTLRDPQGRVVQTRSIAVHDMDRLLSVAETLGAELRDGLLDETDALEQPRYFLSATMAAVPRASDGARGGAAPLS